MEEQLASINSHACDGIIVLATEMCSTDVRKLENIHRPLVILDNFFPTAHYDCVSIDNVSGASQAVKHLINMGHIRIEYLHSAVDIRNFNERQCGYLAACRLLPEQEAHDAAKRIVSVGAMMETALQDMRTYLSKDPSLPTAFFADNDRIAIGCCQALQQYGYRIPEDISVIGFDDTSLCLTLDPPLTTMGVQKQRMGALAVSRLVTLLKNPMPEKVHISVIPDVIVRGTVLQLRNSFRRGHYK